MGHTRIRGLTPSARRTNRSVPLAPGEQIRRSIAVPFPSRFVQDHVNNWRSIMSRSSQFAFLASIAVCFVVLALSLQTVGAQSKSPSTPKSRAEARSIEGVIVRAHSIAGMSVKDPDDKD